MILLTALESYILPWNFMGALFCSPKKKNSSLYDEHVLCSLCEVTWWPFQLLSVLHFVQCRSAFSPFSGQSKGLVLTAKSMKATLSVTEMQRQYPKDSGNYTGCPFLHGTENLSLSFSFHECTVCYPTSFYFNICNLHIFIPASHLTTCRGKEWQTEKGF